MKLYLVRHGSAMAGEDDSHRPLTAEGRDEVRRLASWFSRFKIRDADVWHSGILRAEETALILAEELGLKERVSAHGGLSPVDSPEDFVGSLGARREDLVLVGHQPFMGGMASCLMAGRSEPAVVEFHKAGAACFEAPARRGGAWTLQWLVDPSLLP